MKTSRVISNIFLGFVTLGLLWWLPIFGPMIAGYVVGKRSDNAKQGGILAAIPGLVIFLLVLSVHEHWIYIPSLNLNAPWDVTGILIFIFNTLNAFSHIVNNYLTFIHYAPPYFVIMIIFGIIGGALHFENPEPKKLKKNIENKLKQEYVEIPKQNPLIKKAIKQKRRKIKTEEEPEYI